MFTREVIEREKEEKSLRKRRELCVISSMKGKRDAWCIKLIIIHTSLKIHDKIKKKRGKIYTEARMVHLNSECERVHRANRTTQMLNK